LRKIEEELGVPVMRMGKEQWKEGRGSGGEQMSDLNRGWGIQVEMTRVAVGGVLG
jgi:hypothetical protein